MWAGRPGRGAGGWDGAARGPGTEGRGRGEVGGGGDGEEEEAAAAAEEEEEEEEEEGEEAAEEEEEEIEVLLGVSEG